MRYGDREIFQGNQTLYSPMEPKRDLPEGVALKVSVTECPNLTSLVLSAGKDIQSMSHHY